MSYLNSDQYLKRSAITAHKLITSGGFAIADPPYYYTSGIPMLDEGLSLDGVHSWTISESEGLTASQLSLNIVSPEGACDLLDLGDGVVISEHWRGITGDSETLVRRGTFFISDIETSTDGRNAYLTVTARDALAVAGKRTFIGNLVGDKIHYGRRRFALLVDPNKSDSQAYIFVDGDESSHTRLWADRPAPRVYSGNTNRLAPINGANTSVIYSDGEIHIDKLYFETSVKDGGFGLPKWVECEYWGWSTEDLLSSVTGVTSGHLGVNPADIPGYGAASGITINGWRVEVTCGTASGRVYSYSDNNFTIRATAEDNPVVHGVKTGDTVKLRLANTIGRGIRTVARYMGFQDVSSGHLRYISEIEAPSQEVHVCLPSTDEFKFTASDGITCMEALERIRRYAAPNYNIWADASGNFHARSVVLSEAVTIDRATDATRAAADGDIKTVVRYNMRDKSLGNMATPGSKYLKGVYFHNSLMGNNYRASKYLVVTKQYSHLETNVAAGISGSIFIPWASCISGWPGDYPWSSADYGKVARLQRATVDNDSNTWGGWYVHDSGVEQPNFFDDRDFCTLAFGLPGADAISAVGISEIHLRVPDNYTASPFNGGPVIEILYSDDGIYWVTLGEYDFRQGPHRVVTLSDMGVSRLMAKYLRFRCKVGWYKYTAGLLGTNRHEYSFMLSGIEVYPDQIVAAEADIIDGDFDYLSEDEREKLKYLRGVLGKRVHDTPVDEYAYEQAAAQGLSLADWGAMRASQFLAELARDAANYSVSTVYPTLSKGSSVDLRIARLALMGVTGMVRSATHNSNGISSLEITPLLARSIPEGTVKTIIPTGTRPYQRPIDPWEPPEEDAPTGTMTSFTTVTSMTRLTSTTPFTWPTSTLTEVTSTWTTPVPTSTTWTTPYTRTTSSTTVTDLTTTEAPGAPEYIQVVTDNPWYGTVDAYNIQGVYRDNSIANPSDGDAPGTHYIKIIYTAGYYPSTFDIFIEGGVWHLGARLDISVPGTWETSTAAKYYLFRGGESLYDTYPIIWGYVYWGDPPPEGGSYGYYAVGDYPWNNDIWMQNYYATLSDYIEWPGEYAPPPTIPGGLYKYDVYWGEYWAMYQPQWTNPDDIVGFGVSGWSLHVRQYFPYSYAVVSASSGP